MAALFLSFLAGILTTLNPCVLPILPIVLASSLQPGKWGPVWLGAGLALGFTITGLAFAATGQAFGLDASALRVISAWAFIGFGLVLVIPRFMEIFSAGLQPLANRASALAGNIGGETGSGQLLVGLLLGAVWSPCSGPTLGAAIGLAASAGGLAPAALRMAVFGLGAASVLAILGLGSRQLMLARRNRMMKLAQWAKPVMGSAFLILGALIVTHFDKNVETYLTNAMPDWLVNFTSSV